MKNNILVTGSAGFIGSHVYNFLLKHKSKKYKIYGVDDLSGGYVRNMIKTENFVKLDLRQRKKVSGFIEKIKPEIIYHFAADATEGRSQFTPFSALDRNMVAYMNILIPAIKHGLKKIVVISSMSVYGKQRVPFTEKMEPIPNDIYGINKLAIEQVTKVMASVYGFKYTIFRPHNVYGPGQNMADPYRNVVAIFINRIMQNKKFFIYGNGEQKRSFTYIKDIVPLLSNAPFDERYIDEIFNIGSDKVISLNKLSNKILKKFFPQKVPNDLKPGYVSDRPQEVTQAFCGHSKIKKVSGYKTTELEDGLSKTIRWAKSIGPQKFKYLKSLDIQSDKLPKTWESKAY